MNVITDNAAMTEAAFNKKKKKKKKTVLTENWI